MPAGPDDSFEVAEFLRQRGTLYLIAESEHDDSPVDPFFAAMAGAIRHLAAQLGQVSPSYRLDPPLLMALDKIVQTCPVPMPAWLADSGGKGIQIIAIAHGEAQLRSRWSKDGVPGHPRHLWRQDLAARAVAEPVKRLPRPFRRLG